MRSSENTCELSELSTGDDSAGSSRQCEKSELSELSPEAIHQSLQSRGFTFTLHDGRLRVSPAHQLTDADADAIRAHKAALIHLVNQSLLRPEWFDPVAPVPVPVHELTPAQVHALAHCGKRYEVEPTPLHLLPRGDGERPHWAGWVGV